MAISKIASAGVATDTLTAADLAPDSVGASEIAASAVGISELSSVTGITADYHKVPTFANDSARDAAIGSPAVGMLVYNTTSGAVQQYNGTWSTIAPAPNISSVSGFLNNDTDSTLTIFGTNFTTSSGVKMFTASAGGTQIGSNATTTLNSNTKLTAVFGAGSIGASGSTAYIEVDNAGATNRFATAITVNADPAATFTGGTGAGFSSPTHLGTYNGVESVVDSYTKMLLNFDRGGGIDFEDSSNIEGDGFRLIAGADAVIKASPFGDGKSAMFFDGSNDKLVVTQSAIPSGTSVRSFDFWIKKTSTTNNYQYLLSMGAPSNSASWRVSFRQAGGYLKFNGYSDDHDTTATYQSFLNVWAHLAIVFDASGNLRMYRDGERILNVLDASNSLNTTSSNLTIGHLDDSGGSVNWFTGYMDEFHITNTDRSTNSGLTFPVPTARYTATSATKLLIHSNLAGGGSSFSGYNTFTDSSSTGHTVTASGSIHSTLYNHAENTVVASAMTYPASGKTFGSAGAFFDGTGDYLYLEGAEKLIFAGTWSIDFWVNVTSIGNYDGIISFDQTGAADVAIGFGTGDSKIHLFSDAGTPTSVVNSDDTISLNTWYHIAVTRDGTTTRFFLNGVLKDTDTSWNGTWTPLSSGDAIIGRWSPTAGGQNFHGYLDLLRISIGAARWTSAFTAPTTLYNGVAGDAVVPTITFTGTATQLAADEDIEFTAVENSGKADGSRSLIDTDIGLTLTNLTGGDKSKATLTGTLTSAESTTHTNMPLKLQVRKTLGNAAYANASRVVTFSSSTVTTGLAPAMPVSGTGIPASTTITSVDSTTTITLSANPTGGTLTGQSLIFLDLTRITHLGGSDTLDNTDTMLTIATGAGSGPTLFNARRYVGTGATRSLTGFGFQPDMVWIKERAGTDSHNLFDSVRDIGNYLAPDTASIAYASTDKVLSYSSDGFLLGASSYVNNNNDTFIAWAWKAGGAPSGSLGTIDSSTPSGAGTIPNTGNATAITQSVSQTTGFSITKFTGGSTSVTIPHNLGGTPAFFLIKSLTHAYNWNTGHKNLTSTTGKYLFLDTNTAEVTSSNMFNPAPDSTNFSTGTSLFGGHSGTFMCYCWKAVDGVSAFGTYEGTGGANTITYTGSNSFTASFIMIKNIDATASWMMLDKFRDGTGEWTTRFYADTNGAESSAASYGTTMTSTGFTMGSGTTSNIVNTNNETYIYAAFA